MFGRSRGSVGDDYADPRDVKMARQRGISIEDARDLRFQMMAEEEIRRQQRNSMKKKRLLAFCVIGVVLLAAKLASTGTQSPAESSKMTDAQCREDLSCYGDKFHLRATSACKPFIERLAKNDFEWTDGWTQAKFSRFRWADQSAATIVYIGDKIKFQNGFGAWVRHSYECTYSTSGESVLGVQAFQGQL